MYYEGLGECLRLRSNHNLYLNGRLAESKNKQKNIYISNINYMYNKKQTKNIPLDLYVL